VPQSKDFISIRLDTELKAELQKAADLEQRSISNFGRLLIEYSWSQYLKAGSMRELIAQHERSLNKKR
jgi:predicted transcriptional regulator